MGDFSFVFLNANHEAAFGYKNTLKIDLASYYTMSVSHSIDRFYFCQWTNISTYHDGAHRSTQQQQNRLPRCCFQINIIICQSIDFLLGDFFNLQRPKGSMASNNLSLNYFKTIKNNVKTISAVFFLFSKYKKRWPLLQFHLFSQAKIDLVCHIENFCAASGKKEWTHHDNIKSVGSKKVTVFHVDEKIYWLSVGSERILFRHSFIPLI